MSDACPYFIKVSNSTGQGHGICITELMSVFSNDDSLLQSNIYDDLQVFWMIVTGTLTFFMRMGFSMLQLGMVARRNMQTILFMNIMDSCISCMLWLSFGYGFAWGSGSGFIGMSSFFGSFDVAEYSRFFYSWSFCSFSSTIVSGSVAERCTIAGYFMYSTIITTLIYPVVCHWFWTSNGWLSAHNSESSYPTVDYSGAFSVHLVGGCCALMGAIIIGPRRGRFPGEAGKKIEFGNTNIPMILYGTIVLWYGWYGFNLGATLMFGHDMTYAIRAALMNTFAAGSGGITVGLLMYFENQKLNVPGICFGILSSLVSVTGCCHLISPGIAIIVGLAGGMIYFWGRKLLVCLKIDDPIDGTIVHGLCGLWGGIAAAIFSEEDLMSGMYESLLGTESRWVRLRNNVLGIVCVVAWSCSISGAVFCFVSKTVGLRAERGGYGGGLDMIIFGIPTYKETAEYPPKEHNNHVGGNEGTFQVIGSAGKYQTLN